MVTTTIQKYYNLLAVIVVGYKVNSEQAVLFLKRATTIN